MSAIKLKETVVTQPQENEKGELIISEENLNDLVKSFRKFLLDKKYRNLPNNNPKDTNMLEVNFAAAQYVKQILQVTKGLLEEGVITEDKHMFLSANVNTFQQWNTVLNTKWIPEVKKELAKEEAKAIPKDASNFEKEISSVDVANMVSEPTCEEDTVIDIKTNTGKRLILDKENYTLSFKTKDGLKTYKIIPEDTWRSTILKFLIKFVRFIKQAYKEVKDRCIGVKQTVQFKYHSYLYNRKVKKEAQQSA